MSKMDPVYKEKWCAALESGKFEQVKGALKRQIGLSADGTQECFGHCCLGVLAEIVKDEISGAYWSLDPIDNDGQHEFVGPNDSEGGVLPFDVRRLVGLEDANPCVDITQREDSLSLLSLAGMNDSGEYTFAQIAAIIREQL